MDNSKVILSITFDEKNNSYGVAIPKGSNVAETAFAVGVLIKCLVRDKIIETADEFTNLVNKYVNDPQYQEVE